MSYLLRKKVLYFTKDKINESLKYVLFHHLPYSLTRLLSISIHSWKKIGNKIKTLDQPFPTERNIKENFTSATSSQQISDKNSDG